MCFLLLQYLILIGGQGLCPWIPLGALIAPQIPNWVDIPSPEIPGFATVCPPLPKIAGYAAGSHHPGGKLQRGHHSKL